MDNSQKYFVYLNDGYLEAPNGVYFEGAFTVSAWIQVKEIRTFSRLFDFGNGQADNNVLFCLSVFSSGSPGLEIFSNRMGSERITSEKTVIPLNEWVYLTFVHNTTYSSLFMNGKLVASGRTFSPLNVRRDKNYIGKSNWGSDELANIYIKRMRIFNKALNLEEILFDKNETDDVGSMSIKK